jgi:hypothetical protein
MIVVRRARLQPCGKKRESNPEGLPYEKKQKKI